MSHGTTTPDTKQFSKKRSSSLWNGGDHFMPSAKSDSKCKRWDSFFWTIESQESHVPCVYLKATQSCDRYSEDLPGLLSPPAPASRPSKETQGRRRIRCSTPVCVFLTERGISNFWSHLGTENNSLPFVGRMCYRMLGGQLSPNGSGQTR